jgi:hypothetical protein
MTVNETGRGSLRSKVNHPAKPSRQPPNDSFVDHAPSRINKFKRPLISIVLAFHLVAITCWCIPTNLAGVVVVRKLVQPYFLWSGLFQSWDMFAPSPKSANTYVEAQIVYKDGTREVLSLPRMELLGLQGKFFKERYRKFADNLVDERFDLMLPDVARHIARSKSTPENPVKLVVLVFNFSFIAPGPDGSLVSQPWDRHVLLGYGVRPEDLR